MSDDYDYDYDTETILYDGAHETTYIRTLIALISSKSGPEIYDYLDSLILTINESNESIYNYCEVLYYTLYNHELHNISTLFDELFILSLHLIIDIIDYMILKEYIDPNDLEFQNMIIKQITEQKYNDNRIDKFIYFCRNYLTPETINGYLLTDQYNPDEPIISYSLLDHAIKSESILSKEVVDELFDLFDSINFVYTDPRYTHLMYNAVDSFDFNCIIKLFERGLTVNHPIIFELLFEKMRTKIITFKTFTEINMQRESYFGGFRPLSDCDKIKCEFYKLIFQRPELIIEFFTDSEIDYESDRKQSKIIQAKINDIIKTFGFGTNSDFLHSFNCNSERMYNFIQKDKLLDYVILYQTLNKCGFDFEKKITQIIKPTDEYTRLKSMTLYELYIHGSFPIELMYPVEHQELNYVLCHKIIYSIRKLYERLPPEIINVIIRWL